jgi:hypothetical protein
VSAHGVTDPNAATPAGLVARLDAGMARRLGALPEARGLGFVSSDLDVVHAALQSVLDLGLARGPIFCDWGSGLGAVCALAASLEFEAHGIEIQAGLVSASRELVAELGLHARFAHGSFVSRADEDLIVDGEHVRHALTADAYQALGLTPGTCDVVFAYPWPGEEDMVDRLFLRHATPGALLLTFHECSRVLAQHRTDDAEELRPLGWLGGPGA